MIILKTQQVILSAFSAEKSKKECLFLFFPQNTPAYLDP
jgi:hypothetical protein